MYAGSVHRPGLQEQSSGWEGDGLSTLIDPEDL